MAAWNYVMAGDWIPMRLDLHDDPAVVQVAAECNIPETQVVGILHKLWSWANRQSRNGHAPGVTEKWLAHFLGHAGVTAALVNVRWLEFKNGELVIPKFQVWNSQSAKQRILASRRQMKKRSRSQRDKNVTREEKRREENNKGEGHPPPAPPGPTKKFYHRNGKHPVKSDDELRRKYGANRGVP